MRKQASTTGAFLPKPLVRQLKAAARQQGTTITALVDQYTAAFVAQVERKRPTLALPASKREPRADTAMVVIDRALLKRVRALADEYDTTIRAVLTLAIAQGLGAEVPLAPPTVPGVRADVLGRQTRPIHHEAWIHEAISALAAQRGVAISRLADATLALIVERPDIVDMLDLSQPPTPTPEQRALARELVTLAGGPVAPRPPAPKRRRALKNARK